MDPSQYLDCEVFLTGRDQARLSVAGRDYSGRPALDGALERRLLEAALEPARYGALLFQALFPEAGDDLLAGYREALTIARHEGLRLRLRLHVAAVAPPELHELDWELLYDPRQRMALGRSRETAFCRYLGVSFEPGSAVVGRPRLLVVLSCPWDLAEYDLPAMDRRALSQALGKALAALAERVSWEVLEPPATVERIRDRLVAGEFHALHLQAHGLLPPDRGTVSLVLEADDGRADFVDEELFSEVFEGQRNLRLVTLIACHGGAPAGADPFSGLGPALVRRGLPAVVAMRREISLDAATRFAEHFYRNLARNGQVDAAANEARLQLYLGDRDSSEWGTPALFLHLREGRLWEVREAADRPPAAAADIAREPVLRTLLVSRVGPPDDGSAGELRRRYDRLARDLLEKHGGREVEKSDRFVLLFDRPIQAVGYALAYHRGVEALAVAAQVELAAGVGIHLGEVLLHENPPGDVARGARTVEAEGPAKAAAVRLQALARGRQTLLSRAAFDVARQSAVGEAAEAEKLLWLAHGEYVLRGLEEPVEVFEVGVEGFAPLAWPESSAAASRSPGQETIPGWRPAPGLVLPQRPHWAMERKLGEGGFGEVWLAAHQKTGERRVFKFCYEVSRLRALKREITLFRLLKEELGDRRDIARILDWSFDEAPYFIESEYAAEGNLVEWAEERGGIASVPLAERLEIVAQVATALSAAHSVGVLHKDVKPANVLIGRAAEGRPRVRLSDFGIGAITERERLAAAGITVLGMTTGTEEESSSRSGTRLYMAPELLEGKRATLQADVYALGVMLYQVVVGDLSRALAPGWRREVDDELLREDIAVAVDGSRERRLANALRIAERLRDLESRRREREAERREREEARRAQEALAKSRKRRKLVAVVIGFLALFAGAMVIQSRRVAREAERANREAEAAKQVSQVMVEILKGSDPAAAKGKDTITPRELLERGVEKIRGELGEQPLVRAQLMGTIGTVYRRLGLYEPAEPLLEEALEIRQKHLGGEHTDVATSLGDLAELYRLQGRNEEAETLYQRLLEIREKALGPDHPEVAKGLTGLGILYWRQGRYEEAESVYRRSLRIWEKAVRPGHPGVARTLNNLALLYSTQGRYGEAELLYRRVLEVLEEVQGPESLEVATVVENLGLVYLAQKRFADAERYCLRTLEIREKVLEPGHPEISRSLNNLAELYKKQGRYGEAEPLYQRVVETWKKALGSEHRKVGVGLNNLADVYRAEGRYREAGPLYRRALEIFEKALGPEHIYVAYPLHGLATIYREQQRDSEAEPLYRRALAIRERVLAPGHEEVQETLRGYAKLLRSMDRAAEAEELEGRIEAAQPPP